MEDVDFSDDFCRFVQANVPSVEAAELILALYRNPERAASRDPAAAALVSSEDRAVQAHLRTLDQADRERPVTLIRLIYALRDRKIRSFADAFKLRKS